MNTSVLCLLFYGNVVTILMICSWNLHDCFMTVSKPGKRSWLICLDRWVFLSESFVAVFFFLFFILSFLHFILSLRGNVKWGSPATARPWVFPCSVYSAPSHAYVFILWNLYNRSNVCLTTGDRMGCVGKLRQQNRQRKRKISQTIWEEIFWVEVWREMTCHTTQPHRGARTARHYRKSVERLDGKWLGVGWQRTAGRASEVQCLKRTTTSRQYAVTAFVMAFEIYKLIFVR